MKRSRRYVLMFAGALFTGQIGAVAITPFVVMRGAMARLSDHGATINAFRFADRTTQASRQIVRPSPDLAYASCVYDLSDGPILVEAPASPDGGYLSISVFAGNTDNVAVMDSLRNPEGIRFILQKQGKEVLTRGLPVIYTPTDQGIILDRRLASTQSAFDLADKARRKDSCAPLG